MRTLAAALAALSFAAVAQAAEPKVVVSTKPLQSIAAGVLGKTPPAIYGGDPRVAAADADALAALESADLVVWIGPEQEPALAEAVAKLPPEKVLTLSATDGTEAVSPAPWLNPDNVMRTLELIAERAATLDPENAQLYGDGALIMTRYARVDAAKAEDALAPVWNVPFWDYGAGLGDIAKRYKLKDASPPRLGSASVADLGGLLEAAAERPACVFVGPMDEAALRAAEEDLGVRFAAVDPFLEASDADSHVKLTQAVAAAMAACLSEPAR